MSAQNLEPSSESGRAASASSRRIRLREFQAQLVERMQAAANFKGQTSQLGVVIGQTRWLLSLQEAGEIISVGAIAKVVGSPGTELEFAL